MYQLYCYWLLPLQNLSINFRISCSIVVLSMQLVVFFLIPCRSANFLVFLCHFTLFCRLLYLKCHKMNDQKNKRQWKKDYIERNSMNALFANTMKHRLKTQVIKHRSQWNVLHVWVCAYIWASIWLVFNEIVMQFIEIKKSKYDNDEFSRSVSFFFVGPAQNKVTIGYLYRWNFV